MRAGECELSSCPRKKSTDALSLRFGNPRTKSDRRHLRLKGQIPSIFFRLFRVTINKIDHQMQQSAPGWRRFSKWAAAWRSLGDGVSRQLCSLNGEALSAEARRRTGLEDFGDPPIDTALSTLVNSLELQADLHPLGRFLMWVHLLGLLETRLRLTQAWGGQLQALDASLIQRPVFITGMPRSGSTFLHELMAEDPANRAPRVWEVMFPIPGQSSTRSNVDPRVRKAEASLWWFRRLAPGA